MAKLIVCDPACVQSFGHNLTAVTYYREAFGRFYDDVIIVGCSVLNPAVAEENAIKPFYRFYYSEYFHNINGVDRSVDDDREGLLYYPDELEWKATRDAIDLIKAFNVTAEDSIIFPHLDFYGVVGMLSAVAKLRPADRPKLHLRFIGVMENATNVYRRPLEELLVRLREAFVHGLQIRLSAETPRYADYLALKLGQVVTVTLFPNSSQQMPLNEAGPFVFYCPGSARHDKGFGDLEGIFKAVRRRDPDLKIRFISQILAGSDMKHFGAQARSLYSIPGVELQPSSISVQLMRSTYRRTHAVLLPYAPDVYHWRGSAVQMEAAAVGRLAIAYDDMAFSDLIRFYNSGLVVKDQDAMVEAIFTLAATPRDELSARATQARHRINTDCSSSFRKWMEYS